MNNLFLDNWIEKYGTTEVIAPANPEKCLEELKGILSGQNVHFYGAGAVGQTFYYFSKK